MYFFLHCFGIRRNGRNPCRVKKFTAAHDITLTPSYLTILFGKSSIIYFHVFCEYSSRHSYNWFQYSSWHSPLELFSWTPFQWVCFLLQLQLIHSFTFILLHGHNKECIINNKDVTFQHLALLFTWELHEPCSLYICSLFIFSVPLLLCPLLWSHFWLTT